MLLKGFCAQFLRLGVNEDPLLWPALHLLSGKDWEEAVLSKGQGAPLPPSTTLMIPFQRHSHWHQCLF